MWPILVEFRPASSEIKRRKKRKKKIPVKYKSEKNYVGRPNKLWTIVSVARMATWMFERISALQTAKELKARGAGYRGLRRLT